MTKNKEKHPALPGMQSAIIGLIVNAILAGIKGAAGVLGHSYALIADAIESSLDIVSSIIVWSGLQIASTPPDEDHPYGHGKAEPLAAMIVSATLFCAAVIIAFQSIKEIHSPHITPAPFTLGVLVIVVVTKEILFRFVIKTGEDTKSTAVKTDAWHHRSDAITSLAAFVGISVALLGGKGFESADDWAALFASFIIAFNAINLFRPALNELMDAVPPPEIEQEVRRVAATVKGVVGLDKCFIRKMGFDYYIDLHVTVNGEISVRDGHHIAHRVKDAIREANNRVADVSIHIEPHLDPHRRYDIT